ncbi:DNA-directed RNA polymerase sigma-70 factor [Paractinoplanes abujensis]|uniref:RNA polymerase sigma-70 factor (Sigma-E family) n=1 Tax=Paractinoplanes abujensis TaxID=882441 RepID=A0A7W7G1S7_9ACTN|nr:SigE family RNA polymerase sigma factor [Actinoplanes abujensis]MBB4692949.1 RNA polymerase sigma-70 factor (sigma-E family) [Actinoplanes abujensis]GID22549.1 DNA-directed RNA polymerase sigma-70 factor [Actinoplanes abujensis]
MARGDDDFIAFAQASSARLQRAAYLLTGDRHQAEEAAQATLVRVYAAWGRVRRKDPYAYARTVLTNLVTDQWRRPMREYATEVMPEQPATQDVADVVSKRRWLIGVLQGLSPRERAVIVLRHFFDASEAEVARELGLSAGTVKSLNSRALAKLRITAGLVPPLRTETEAGVGL